MSNNINDPIKEWLDESNRTPIDILIEEQQKNDSNNPNPIGERIKFLMKHNFIEVSEFCRNAGISRSTLYRCISEDYCPTVKILRKIITALYVSEDIFCCFPTDFKKWKSTIITTEQEKYDIFEFKEKLLNDYFATNRFTYNVNSKEMPLPNKYYSLIKKSIEFAFEAMELLPHDE